MTDLAGGLQRWLFATLSAVDGLPPVVTEAPTSTEGDVEYVVYPFILIGEDHTTDQSSKSGRFEKHEPTIHACFQSSTKLEVKSAQELIRARLHNSPIVVDGATFSPLRFTGAPPIATLEDGATQVGSQLFETFGQDA